MSGGAAEADVDIFGKALKLSGEIATYACFSGAGNASPNGGRLAPKVTSTWTLCLTTNAERCNRISTEWQSPERADQWPFIPCTA